MVIGITIRSAVAMRTHRQESYLIFFVLPRRRPDDVIDSRSDATSTIKPSTVRRQYRDNNNIIKLRTSVVQDPI